MIQVEHLTKYYGGFFAVDDVSFTISDGHVYGFLGPNGAGKSTTMNIITGCLSATAGRVRIDGHDIYDLVAEWNRPYMKDLFRDIEAAGTWGAELRPIADAYQDGGDAAAQAIADNFPQSNGLMTVKTEWKRLIGIAIACVNKMEEVRCPYPIKIVRTHGKYRYEDLVPSLNCQ